MIAWVASGALLGAIFGSFIGALVHRWPAGRSVLVGRSQCDSCGRRLGAVDLIPVAGFLIRGGRCHACGAKIGRDHLWLELSAIAIGTLSLAILPEAAGFALAAMGWLLLALGWLDARHLWLPDPLVAILAFLGLGVGGLVSGVDIVDRLIAGAAGFASLEIIRRIYGRIRAREGMGAGDPKLMGAVGLWTGWAVLPIILLVASGTLLLFALLMRRANAAVEYPLGTALAAAAFIVTAAQAAMIF